MRWTCSSVADLTSQARPSACKRADAEPVEVELIPGQAVAGRHRMRVMIVVPALAEGEHRHPPVVRRIIARLESSRAPEVRGRVHQPCAVQAKRRAEEHRPEHVRDTAKREQREPDDDLRDPVPLGERDVERVAAQVGHVAAQHIGVVMHRLAGEDPPHVRPERALARRMRVAVLVRVLMMNAMSGDPEDRSAFERQRAAGGQEVLDPFRCLVAAMREEAVIAHADPKRTGNDPESDGRENGAGIDNEEGGHGADVERRHRNDGDPVDGAFRSFAPVERGHGCHVACNGNRSTRDAL